ncbi:MAG TPA: LysR family transcriptional regulator [Burkholderiales bacterium]|nr:LysR family transcriptional regulator [Burkholderiales bacterium]
MRFSLAQLETLLWVVRLGSFRAAANRLNITQPAVSVRIRQLERTAGGKLFLKGSYRAKPTPLGREVAAHAEQVIAACEDLEGRFAAGEDLRGPIRIGVADTFAMTCLPELMRQIEKRFPRARAEIRVDFSALLDASLRSGDLDVAVLTAPAPSPLVTVEPLAPLELRWVASPKLALRKGALKPADLAPLPIITNPNPSHLYTSITGWFAAAGVQPAHLNTCNSLVIMTRLALEGAAISLLPVAILRREISSKALRVLNVTPRIAGHVLAVAYRRDAPGQGLRTLARMMQELARASDLIAAQ